MLIRQGPVDCESATSTHKVNSLTVCSVQLRKDQTTPLDVCHKLRLHAVRTGVLKMGREGRLQKVRAVAALRSDSGLFANLMLQLAFTTERIQVVRSCLYPETEAPACSRANSVLTVSCSPSPYPR